MRAFFFFFFVFVFGKIWSQTAPNISPLTIGQIMAGEEFVGYLPDNVAWSEDSRTIFFSWNPNADTLRGTYKIAIRDGQPGMPEKVGPEEQKALPTAGVYNKSRSKMAYAKNGDLFLLDLPSSTAVKGKKTTVVPAPSVFQVTQTTEQEGSPIFSGDGSQLVYERADNLYAWNIATGATEQLTDFRKGSDRRDRRKNPQAQWLENDNLAMFEVLAERKADRDAQKRQRESLKPKRPKAYFTGEKRVADLSASPDLRFITFRLITDGSGEDTDVPSYVTESGKVDILKSRPKVGSMDETSEFGIYDRQRDTVFLVETTQIEGIYDKPAFLKEYHQDTLPYEAKFKDPRTVAVLGPVFSEDGKAVVVVRSMDSKDRWIMLLDLPTGKLKLLDRQHDDAWIGGPGIVNWTLSMGNIGWMPDNQRVWFHSEESGYSHLYTVDVETGAKKALTSGSFEILDASLSKDRRFFYLTSNRETPFEHHFYRMPVEGGSMEKITAMPGSNQVALSPDEQWLAIRYSYSNQPWELYLMPNRPGEKAMKLTNSLTADFQKYPWREPEMVWFKASDGTEVPARLYRPKASLRNGAAVVFVHGAGYLQNVHRWWSTYYREFMFHNLLADNGFTVLDIDYRGSQGYGRDWRTAIYRHMGGKDLSDQVDGARFLVAEHGIDPARIGIYGGSYGGFITLMAQFTAPGTFKSGAALRSVTDWAHYNHGYTSNILNTPVEDSIAYRRSSPIYFADGLKGHLLILHGMVDTNVQFQDVVRLSQRLIELKKENWELAVFPMEDHGFVEPSSWTDEYRRIYELFWKTLAR